MHKFQDKTFVLISLASAPQGLFSIFLSNSYLELILIRDLVQIIWLLVWFFLLNLVQIFCLLVHLIWAERSCFWDLIEFELKKWFMMNLSLSFWLKQFLSSRAELNQVRLRSTHLADMIKNETFRYQFLHFIWWIALLCSWFDSLVSIFLLAFSVTKTYNFFSC
jgi:hypothetical protein